jgi:hypothetical protein
MVPAGVHDLLGDALLGSGARSGAVFERRMVNGWLGAFRAAATARAGGAISRGGLYQRVFTLLSLELWMRDNGMTWS